VTRRETFQHLGQWLQEAKQYSSANIAITIVGNKADIQNK
jgi:GTPase SAR1 family protein